MSDRSYLKHPGKRLTAQTKDGKPYNAPDDSKADAEFHRFRYFPSNDANRDAAMKKMNQLNHDSQPSFYDREALEERLHGLKAEGVSLSEAEIQLQSRLSKAEATLSAMRARKRNLSRAKLLGDLTKIGGNKSLAMRECLAKDRKYKNNNDNGEGGLAQRQEELINVSTFGRTRRS